MVNHHNHDTSGSPELPVATGDNYYSHDIARDFFFMLDRIGLTVKDFAQSIPCRANGLVVTHNPGTDTLNITVGAGYATRVVRVPGDAGVGIPPTYGNATIEAIRVEVRTAIASYSYAATATLDGSTPNYVKLSYADETIYSRNRRWRSGSYAYEQKPKYTLTVSAVAPTSADIVLHTFTSSGSGSGFTFGATSAKSPWFTGRGENPIGTIIAVDKRTLIAPDANFYAPCDGVASLPTEYFDTSTTATVPVLNDDRFLQGASGAYAAPGGANTLTTSTHAGHTHAGGDLFACVFPTDFGGASKIDWRLGTSSSWTITDTSAYASSSSGSSSGSATTGVDVVGTTATDGSHDHTITDSRPKYFSVNFYIRIA